MLIKTLLSSDNYFGEAQTKDLIVLHFTAGGTTAGAISTFSNGSRVAVAYIVTPGGDVHELFNPSLWAYHLGMKQGNTGHVHDKRSIGIELVNWGPLRLAADGKTLCAWPNNFTTSVCDIADTARYVKCDFRGEKYFQAIPLGQACATQTLCEKLCRQFNIPKRLPTEETRFQCVDTFRQFKGVASHVNFRADKSDLAPVQSDEVWRRLLQAGYVAE